MNGLDVIRHCRAHSGLRRLPIVVLSSSALERDSTEAYRCGANAYVVKPLEFADLQRVLEATLLFWRAAIVAE